MSADTKVDVYLPLYVRDFLTSTIGWTAEERGHYLTLLMIQWDRGALPAEPSDLERLSPGVAECWPVLACKFPTCEDGTRKNAKLEEHRCRCVEIREKRSQAAKSAASGRWSGDASRIANASQTHSKRIAKVCHPTSTSTSTSDTQSPATAEDFQPAAPVVATSDSPKRRNRSQPKDAISWSVEDGWQRITEEHRQAWATAYPACNLDIELVRASEWLIANPTKARKSNWRRFLVSWLTRSQDRGGTIRSVGKTPDEVVRKERLERKVREFSEYKAAPYRTPKEVAALATALRLKEEEDT
jgi:uncharacterized protein YdaU (DUF1376 family)